MPRKEKETLQSYLKGLKDSVKRQVEAQKVETRRIPSILEFIDSREYLGLPFHDPPIRLFKMQRLALQAFYRGSEGNTGPDMEFKEEDIAYLRENGLDTDDRGDVVSKIQNGAIFRELILVWGRRSGKDFVSSIIALYEVMRLLETPGGDPYAVYRLQRGGNPITVLTIANSQSQATIAFQEMKAKLMQSPYFQNKFIKEGLTSSSIYLLTPQDRKDNEDRERRGLPQEKGSIMLRAGHSNSDSLLGIQCFVLLLDEVASFKNTAGSSGGSRIYEAMLPSLGTFVRRVPKVDENGEPVIDPKTGEQIDDRVFDSKVVSISSPRGKEGILWDMFKEAPNVPNRLVFRLPTWVVNEKYTKESLRATVPQFNDERFMMEFGADFSPSAGTNFFTEDAVNSAFKSFAKFVNNGSNHIYFAHLDPATNSHNYVLAICHKEVFVNREEGQSKADYRIVLDHLRIWTPMPGRPIQIAEVDDYILMMNLRFHLGLVTYDAWNSAASIQKLRRVGIPSRATPYNNKYKNVIYDALETLINENRLVLPHDDTLKNEMLNLQRRWTGRGYSVTYNKECDTPTDDACDALAGAAYNALASHQMKYATTRLVAMPVLPQQGMGGIGGMRTMQGGGFSPRVLDHIRARNGMTSLPMSPQPRPGY